MPYAFSQASSATSSTAATLTTSYFANPTKVGSLVVFSFVLSGITETLSSVTDSAGNAYVISSPVDNTVRTYQVYGVQVASATTISYTKSAAVLTAYSGALVFLGAKNNNANTFHLTSTGTGATVAMNVTLFSPTTGNLVVATYGTNGVKTTTAGTGFTNGINQGAGSFVGSIYELVSIPPENCPASFTTAANWSGIAMSFNPTPLPVKSFRGMRVAVRRASFI